MSVNTAVFLLSLSEVAKQLGVSGKTVTRFCDQKLINFIKVGHQYRFRQSAVDLFLAQREVKARVSR